ncbi:MAG: thioredoxin family protein [Phycisphaerales bacterium]
MARTPSTMIALGTAAPGFRLPDAVSGKAVSLDDFSGADVLLVMFICNHCPYVKHVRDELARLGRDYGTGGPASRGGGGKRVGIVAISSNDVVAYPDDSPEKMATEAREARYTFPYLFDADQSVAKAYQAACTPDFFVFDGARKLVYRGQLDDSRPSRGELAGTTPVPVTGRDVRAALDAVLSGGRVNPEQRASLGCNIKWRPQPESQVQQQ